MLFWFLFWFLAINLAVIACVDQRFFRVETTDRLLVNPSENEAERVIAAMKEETDVRHIVFLGNSVAWGIGVDDPALLMSGRVAKHFEGRKDVRVVNLAVPGASLLDLYAILRKSQNPKDLFLVTLNTTFAEDEAKYSGFDELVRFPDVVKEEFSSMRDDISACCSIVIPPPAAPVSQMLQQWAWTLLPLYRDRDVINRLVLDIQPSIAVDAALHRILNAEGAVFSHRPMAWKEPAAIDAPKTPASIDGSAPLRLLAFLHAKDGTAPNVWHLLIDDRRYDHGAQERKNVALIHRTLSGGKIVDFYGTLKENFYDTVHLSPEGHATVARALIPLLDHVLPAP